MMEKEKEERLERERLLRKGLGPEQVILFLHVADFYHVPKVGPTAETIATLFLGLLSCGPTLY